MTLRDILIFGSAILAAAGNGTALAGGRTGVGISIGLPLPGFGGPPPVYSPPPAPAEPTTYIERDPSAPAEVWYYCANSRAYYPYVRECPGGWQLVPAGRQP